MAKTPKRTEKKTARATVGYEAELWQMADALRGSMDAAEYKHVVLGLILPVPPLAVQHAIAHILGALDDKIELNRRMNETLDETLRMIARELVEAVRRNVTIDWTIRENVRAQLQVLVKRILRKLRLSAGQAGEGDADGAGAGSAADRFVGGSLKRSTD